MNYLELAFLVESSDRVLSCIESKNFDEAERHIQNALAVPRITEEQRDYILIYEVTILAMKGEGLGALRRIVELRERRPLDLRLLKELWTVWQKVADAAHEILAREPDSRELMIYHQLLRTSFHSPWWLTLAVAKQIYKTGQRNEAVGMVRAVIELSPNDPDYLRDALDFATSQGEVKWAEDLRAHILQLIRERPYDLALQSIFPGR